jgi:predicted enzyme related to lactoylglutathione lyase
MELLTSAIPAELAPFYEKTFGWTRAELLKGANVRESVTLLRGGRPVAKIIYHEAETIGLRRARWVPVFARAAGSSEDLAEVVKKAGGQVLNKEQTGELGVAGRPVLLLDAESAVAAIIQGEEGEATGGLWPVLVTNRPDMAAPFYQALLGWEPKAERRTPLFPGDFLFFAGEVARAGTAVQSTAGIRRAGWIILVGVADIEATTLAAKKAGGRVMRSPSLDLIGGRVAVIADPRGAVFGLYELVPVAARTVVPNDREIFEVKGIAK